MKVTIVVRRGRPHSGTPIHVLELHSRKVGDRKRKDKTILDGDVPHEDQDAAKRLVREHDPESWDLMKREVAGRNPDIVLDKESGEIIFRPAGKNGKKAVHGKKIIRTKVRPADHDRGLYDRLRRARFETVASLLGDEIFAIVDAYLPDSDPVLLALDRMLLNGGSEDALPVRHGILRQGSVETTMTVTHDSALIQIELPITESDRPNNEDSTSPRQ